MNRTLKTLALFLMVSTLSFVSAQDKEVDDDRKGGAGKSVVDDNTKAGAGVKLDGILKPDVKKPTAKRLDSHETGSKTIEKDLGKDKRGFWSKLFNKKKVKKEDDPN